MCELEAKELRIGNLVYKDYPDGQEIVIVEKLSKMFVNGLGLSGISPVPLTEEWLIKFGFIQSMALTNYWSECEDFNIFIDSDGIHYSIPLDHEGNFWKIKKIEYVHQLQNIYHSLTEKELTHQKIN